MAEEKENLNARFAPSSNDGLPPDILSELESMLRLHSIPPKELFFKWESYCLKMGSEETKLNLETVRMFKKDVQDAVERESRGKHNIRSSDRRAPTNATPRNASNGDFHGMLDDLIPNTPMPRIRNPANANSMKRKAGFDSPMAAKVGKTGPNSGAANFKTPIKSDGARTHLQAVPFSERQNAGQIIETLNDHLPTVEAPIVPFAESRVKVAANTDIKKFSYKPMSMRQSESSEVLDERIDEYMSMIQKAHALEDSAFGNPTAQSTSEIIAVGRIACDTPDSKLSAASVVLETSRRMGAGVRVPLKIDALPSYQFFPGKIIAVKGSNASGEYFTVTEILDTRLLPSAVSPPAAFESIKSRVSGSDGSSSTLPLNFMFSSGPYTADDNLSFEPLQEICQKAEESVADVLILSGPFLDLEHPLLTSGDFDIPEGKSIDPDAVNMTTLFRLWIGTSLQRLASAVSSITILLIPSIRDAVNRHVSWPQDMLQSKAELGLPKQARLVTNPITLSLNETVVGISTQDVLYELRQEELSSANSADLLTRLPKHLIEQRHFFPLFPPTNRERLPKAGGDRRATGACLDLGYLKLGEWPNVRPDLLIMPSVLPPFVKVVESVLVINPGPLSKRKGAGTYAQLAVQPRTLTDEEKTQSSVAHRVFERARVDIVRI